MRVTRDCEPLADDDFTLLFLVRCCWSLQHLFLGPNGSANA